MSDTPRNWDCNDDDEDDDGDVDDWVMSMSAKKDQFLQIWDSSQLQRIAEKCFQPFIYDYDGDVDYGHVRDLNLEVDHEGLPHVDVSRVRVGFVR